MAGPVDRQRVHAGEPAEGRARIVERGDGRHRERPREQAVTQLAGPADRAQGRVEDGDAVAQPLGLLEAVGRQEDRGAALAQARDQLVDLAGGDGVEAGRRLVEEQHLRVAEERSRQGDPLAEALGQRAATVRRPVREVHRGEGPRDPLHRVVHLVEIGEALQVLLDAEARIQARRLGHDGDPPADLDAVRGREGEAADRGGPRARREERGERPDRGGLPRAVGPEEPEDLAALDLERHVLEGHAVAESLAQPDGGQRGRGPSRPRPVRAADCSITRPS